MNWTKKSSPKIEIAFNVRGNPSKIYSEQKKWTLKLGLKNTIITADSQYYLKIITLECVFEFCIRTPNLTKTSNPQEICADNFFVYNLAYISIVFNIS